MIILFDNCGFSHLAQQPQWASHFVKLKELIDRKRVTIVGSCTMLHELVGLAQTNAALYFKTLSDYEEVTRGKILNQSQALAIGEAETLAPIGLEASLLNVVAAEGLLRGFKDPTNFGGLHCEAKSLKRGYADSLEQAHDEIVTELTSAGHPGKSLPEDYKKWFKDFDGHVQDWFVHMFRVGEVRHLQHVSAFLGFALTRVYERFCCNVKDRDNDHFDRAHFTDAAVVDLLVTNDTAFQRTALMVPNRPFDVKNLAELSVLIEELRKS